MSIIAPIPELIISPNELRDGQLIKAPSWCMRRFDQGSCKDYYQSIEHTSGFHTCPKGMVSYVVCYEDNRQIFTCLRTREHCDKAKTNKINHIDEVYNPVVEKKTIENLINNHLDNVRAFDEVERLQNFFREVRHEIVKMNGEIVELSETLHQKLENDKEAKKKKLDEIALKIFHFSRMISNNFIRFDLVRLRGVALTPTKIPYPIYSKFHMIKKCLDENAKKKFIEVRYHGSVHGKMSMDLSAFELIPYMLLDNAIKYSPDNRDIDVNFTEKNNEMTIIVTSLGPQIEENEYNTIFHYGVRGKHSSEYGATGSGLGLYMVKSLCDIHDIKITCISVIPEQIGSKVYYHNSFVLIIKVER